LLTFALDSVGDVFGSLFFIAAGVSLLGGRELPRWLAWAAVAAGVLLFFQGFGLGGVISDFGLFLDLVGFLLLLIFVLASSVILLFRSRVVAAA
jgi:heme A synthase